MLWLTFEFKSVLAITFLCVFHVTKAQIFLVRLLLSIVFCNGDQHDMGETEINPRGPFN